MSAPRPVRPLLLALGLIVAVRPQGLAAQQQADTARQGADAPAAPPSGVARQSLDDAWWTGPILTNGAGTLPAGHFLVEPYFYDVTASGSNGYGSRAYVLYGIADRLTAGVIPIVGYTRPSNGPSSSGVRFGDFTVAAQYRLTLFRAGRWTPTSSFEVQETFPTGAYDRLGNRPSNGIGSGAYTTTLSLNTQTFFWMPDGRILRMRFNVFQAFSSEADVEDVSVYGTPAGFRGRARPGSSSYVYASGEYSVTRRWVLALDATYTHTANTSVTGYNLVDSTGVSGPPGIRLDSGSSDALSFAPAVEYNWSSNLGVIVGARLVPAGHNTTASVTPVVAINMVY